MKIEQIYTNCLAQGAYYLESNGEAAIVDPLREVQQYIDLAESRNAKIKYIFETHFHADFVSGHVDLAQKTGAQIVYGPTQVKTGFDVLIAEDNQEFKLGNATIKLIHTPGHTMESSCYLLIDEEGEEQAIFTGDTLFIGDVGRPDLAQHVVKDLTQEKLASHLYDSLRNKIMPLADDIIVYPAHGAGSACGKNLSSETSDTLGNQKKTNYALNPELSKEEFVEQLLDGLVQPPGYFPKNVLMNIQGYNSIDDVIEKGKKAYSVEEFEQLANQEDVMVLDTRRPEDFVKGFVPGSWSIGVNGDFAVWVGTLIKDINQKILLICEPGKEEEAIVRLARVGYDNPIGFLEGGLSSWLNANKEIDTIKSISPQEFETIKKNEDVQILDVRKASEHNAEHIIGAKNIPLDFIHQTMNEVNKEEPQYIHCAGGYRSVIFSSILKSKGFNNLINIEQGFDGLKKLDGLELTEYVCPTTML